MSNTNKNANKPLDALEIVTASPVEYVVIWLHGLGASGHDFEPIIPELGLLQRPGVKFIFPHAPVRPITINGGAAMRGWYDITSLDFEQREQDLQGTLDSANAVMQLIDTQIEQGIDSRNILLAGFSQGGAIALYTALTYTRPLGGVMGLSTYLPIADTVISNVSDENSNIPIFLAHGTLDETIALKYAESSREVLRHIGFEIEWHTYPIAHSVSADEIDDLSKWLKRLFGM